MHRLAILVVAALATAMSVGCARPAPPVTGQLVTAEVPPKLIEQVRADLAQRAGIAASDAKVVRAEIITWPNGAMGCAQPGQFYTQATVPGYVVELEHGGTKYSYHAAQNGRFSLCEKPTSEGAGSIN
jgi:hypothetical protein